MRKIKGEAKRAAKKPSRQEKIGHLHTALTYVKNFRFAIDVGAHVGNWTRVMAERFEYVVAFEPLASNQARWRRHMEGVENVELVCAAVGDENVMTRLQDETHSKHYCIKDDAGDVEMLRLDDWLDKNYADPIDLDFLKVDTEGADALVLRGAEKVIRRCRPVVIVESVPRFEARFGLSEGAPMKYLEELGAVRVAEIWRDYIYVFPPR